MGDTTSVTASCLCKANSTTLTLPSSSLTLPHTICHCDSCRRVSGLFSTSFVELPGLPGMGDFSTLGKYNSSKALSRYFCKTCGMHMFTCRGTQWKVATGALDKVDGIIHVQAHMWIGDTLDGGLSEYVVDVEGKQLPRFKEGLGTDTLPVGWKSDTVQKSSAAPENDRLNVKCHCGGVQLYITRPAKDVPENLQRYVRNGTHWTAGLCACTSCRKASGCDIQPWTFVAPANIFSADGRNIEFPVASKETQGRVGTLRCYHSSPGVHREFCGTCGATVFFYDDERRQVIDISPGLYELGGVGVRREDWFVWRQRVSYEEDAIHQSLLDGLKKGLKEKASPYDLRTGWI